ncbi:CD3324 family protein [Tissierella sp.]|uniref:CD3324 family protein n=1 Tax=Tissierella sp. TaxID=41274 RepID=UPI0028677D5D|nr:CD3324 family protein [Tissierella sp.]MDR7855153.1 CD3324 family protein [Tissierella sp.]
MKYINATEVLPKHLLTEIQKHVRGELLYIPSGDKETGWGEKNGSKKYFKNRNEEIKEQFQRGYSIEQLSSNYGLAYETVRKIVYKK